MSSAAASKSTPSPIRRGRNRRLGKIALVMFAILAAWFVYVTYGNPGWYLRATHPLKYPEYIRAHSENYGVPAPLIAAVVMQESGFDHKAVSDAGALGLMQLTPDTAEGIATRTGGTAFNVDDLLDPEINMRYGTWYLAHLHEQFGDEDATWVSTLAAYNAGQGRVRSWIADDENGRLDVHEIPFAETRSYVENVLDMRDAYEEAYPSLRGS